jgi:hypothetical protein
MLARTLRNVKSRLLANSNNLIKRVSAAPECYDNCQLLQPVNEPVPVIQPRDVNHRRFAIPLTTTISSQTPRNPVFSKALRFVSSPALLCLQQPYSLVCVEPVVCRYASGKVC